MQHADRQEGLALRLCGHRQVRQRGTEGMRRLPGHPVEPREQVVPEARDLRGGRRAPVQLDDGLAHADAGAEVVVARHDHRRDGAVLGQVHRRVADRVGIRFGRVDHEDEGPALLLGERGAAAGLLQGAGLGMGGEDHQVGGTGHAEQRVLVLEGAVDDRKPDPGAGLLLQDRSQVGQIGLFVERVPALPQAGPVRQDRVVPEPGQGNRPMAGQLGLDRDVTSQGRGAHTPVL